MVIEYEIKDSEKTYLGILENMNFYVTLFNSLCLGENDNVIRWFLDLGFGTRLIFDNEDDARKTYMCISLVIRGEKTVVIDNIGWIKRYD